MAYSSEIEKLEKRWLENPKGRNFAPLADAYRKAGELDRAIELCVSGLERHPDYVSAHIVYGRCLIDQKNDVTAESVFQKVLTLDPENIIALKVLAELADRGERYDEAVDWLSRLLAADPMNGEADESLKQARTKAAAAKAAIPNTVESPVPQTRPSMGQEPGLIDLDAVAEAPTTAMSQPSFTEPPLVEHDDVVLTAGTRSADIETFDGDLGLVSNDKADGLVVEESQPLEPDGLSVEGLARTQYEGSGMFRLDAREGPPPATDEPIDSLVPMDSGPVTDLPLIMPDDGPRPRRSSAAIPAPEPAPGRSRTSEPVPAAVQLSDDDGAADTTTLSQAEPVVTETMGDLYLQQGHREDALRVYRALLAQRPGDARLAAKLREMETPPARKPATPPAESASEFLRRVWRGQPARPAPAPEPSPEPSPELTGALAAAFAAAPRVSESISPDGALAAPGNPTHAADDVISLDSVFGDQVGRGSVPEAAPPAAPSEPPAGGSGGFSFDDFFGSSQGGAGAPARAPARPSRPSRPQPEDDDLDQFQAWLKGLKT